MSTPKRRHIWNDRDRSRDRAYKARNRASDPFLGAWEHAHAQVAAAVAAKRITKGEAAARVAWIEAHLIRPSRARQLRAAGESPELVEIRGLGATEWNPVVVIPIETAVPRNPSIRTQSVLGTRDLAILNSIRAPPVGPSMEVG
jgi:hypothetical protein